MGNLFSVKHACEHAGLEARITPEKKEILSADAVILPGIGAFGDAMDSLNRLDLVSPLREVAASHRPLVGICLGLQLLMEEGSEFGIHQGLGVIKGQVVRFDNAGPGCKTFKVPQVGWNRIFRVSGKQASQGAGGSARSAWPVSPLEGIPDGEFMYFVHSFYVMPLDSGLVLTTTRYGDTEFCSSLRRRNIFACQFHPERSGPWGLQIYRNLAAALSSGA
jgi:glutamine amidotransferase